MTSDEFSSYKYFTQILNFWWIVALAAFVGGALGFAFYHLHPPVYEATATYFVTIDLNRFPIKSTQEDMYQYSVDMAVGTTEGALLSSRVMNDLIKQLNTTGISVNSVEILKNFTIERKQDVWELRYRSRVPQDAQTIVNTWAQIGYQAMLNWQASGKAPDFVIFQPPTLALIPTRPVVNGRNSLMLAGTLIGFAVGMIICVQVSQGQLKNLPQMETPSNP